MNSFTTPGFADEKQAAESFDEIVQASGLFRSYHEVRGRLIQPRYHQEDKDVRIDRILIPTAKLAGWAAGWIGVEFKRSDTKIGRPLSQIADYTRALFELPPVNGLIQPSWFFLWPAEKEAGDLASWMAQQRIGTAMPSVRFSTGEVTVLSFWRLWFLAPSGTALRAIRRPRKARRQSRSSPDWQKCSKRIGSESEIRSAGPFSQMEMESLSVLTPLRVA